MKQNTTLEIALTEGYVPRWGTWEIIREFLQNWADRRDETGTGSVSYDRSVGRNSGDGIPIRIRNPGTSLDRSVWCLGKTSKASGGSRGRFGEGLDLATMVACRLGLTVVIKNDSEIWKPRMGFSSEFREDILMVDVSPRKPDGDFTVEIYGVAAEDWEEVQTRCLFLREPENAHDLGNGERILMDPKHSGMLYVRGLFVGMLPDAYKFGYDLRSVELDRDRKMADPWSLRSAVKSALERALTLGLLEAREIMTLAGQETGEARALLDSYRWGSSDALSGKMAEAFQAQHGTDAVPVSSLAESAEATAHGLRSVMVSEGLRTILEKDIGKFADKVRSKEMDIRTRYGAPDLTAEEMEIFSWATATVALADPTLAVGKIQVVDFHGGKILGRVLPDTMEIALSRKALATPECALEVLVHEHAHKDGSDGSAEHYASQIRLLAKIATMWSR